MYSEKHKMIRRKNQVPSNYKLVSFDVQSLFTNVHLDQIINIIIDIIYSKKKTTADISHCEMKEMPYLYTKNVHFLFDNSIYNHNDGIAMGSPLGPILDNIVERDTPVLPCLASTINIGRRLVDKTICFKKAD